MQAKVLDLYQNKFVTHVQNQAHENTGTRKRLIHQHRWLEKGEVLARFFRGNERAKTDYR